MGILNVKELGKAQRNAAAVLTEVLKEEEKICMQKAVKEQERKRENVEMTEFLEGSLTHDQSCKIMCFFHHCRGGARHRFTGIKTWTMTWYSNTDTWNGLLELRVADVI